ncbi:MAG: ABC transporter ATP-binding protein [Phycisphaerales bacterium JB043]
MSTPITISSLTKRFAETTAVNAIDLEIRKGELYFLLGPSGCGKSTLLRMIAGLTDPTAGTIRFGDRDVTKVAPNKRNVGMVFQSYALWPHMTVAQNVAFGLKVRKVKKDEQLARTKEALAAVHMDGYENRKPGQLSGGQQQRVALARAMVIKPDVLLLDEPLSNLDAALRIELRSEIRRICKEADITTVYVTHDQAEALSMADRMAVLRDGVVEQIGSPTSLYRAPNSQFVAGFLGETNLIPATIESVDGDTIRLNTPAGALTSTNHPDGVTLSQGQSVTCSIRPEAILINHTPANNNTISAKVLDAIFLGSTTQLTVELAPNLNAHVLYVGTRSFSESDTVPLSIDPSRIVTLPNA